MTSLDAITAQQMRDLEQNAIESGATTGLEMMERAGLGVVEAVFQEWPCLAVGAYQATVLCGPGNNGGDGFVVSRLLQARGWAVEVILFGVPKTLPQDARANYERISQKVVTADSASGFLNPLPDLLVDAVFGIGMTRPPGGILCQFMDDIVDCSMPLAKVAVDIPTGLHADTGEAMGQIWRSDLTVTFHKPKTGHLINKGPTSRGKLVVKDIGL